MRAVPRSGARNGGGGPCRRRRDNEQSLHHERPERAKVAVRAYPRGGWRARRTAERYL